MVIGRKDGLIFITLEDGECLPEKFNIDTVVAFRQGPSTGRELKIIKEAGKLADPGLLRPPAEDICNYSGDGNPLHEHVDGTFWYYDETWAFENGPFDTRIEANASLESYCKEIIEGREKQLTAAEICETLGIENETPK